MEKWVGCWLREEEERREWKKEEGRRKNRSEGMASSGM